MPAPEIVRHLVQRFEEHLEAYRSGKYNETQLRREFLDPFFEALGWDVFNKLGYSEENKHVIHEDSLDVEGVKKAPDYAFKVGRERKFFVEAKKPQVKIETNAETAFQLRRYVWSAKLPLGILTDFEEFAVYECRSKPKVSDSVKTGRVLMFHYTDYIEKWDEIASIFSYDAVMKGGFDKYAGSAARKKGTAEVDEAFLDEIDGWREALARNIALRNRNRVHNEADLNYAVQMTIDRIIFLRICEERGFESENQLQNLAKHEDLYEALKRLFEKADKRYNSGLFHFKEEKGRGRADAFTMGLEIDDKVLKDIVKDLYYPSPYVFSQIPADILGQIYEQFLGKVIRLTAGGNAKVEEKPEVRKAGGVFYTPTFIVDYIVANTLGKLLDPSPIPSPNEKAIWRGGMPEQASKLKIVDPACGSGTFLLGAYQYLLDWHLNWYLNNDFEKWSKGKKAVLVQGKDGWKLNVEKKKEILLNNIYGVDIDPQAVEVTKLSLLLKVIEDPGQLSYLDERILPDLGKNIQCGNSLIGPDYWEGQSMVSEEDRAGVNAFDWKAAFPDVFAQGGFDAVVGNPPYIRIQAMQEWASEQVEFYKRKYNAASKGNYDIYVVFVEKAVSLLNKNGRLGFILPHKFFNAQYGEPLRNIISEGKHLSKVVHFGDQQVFSGATTYTCLMFLNKQGNGEFEFTKVNNLEDWRNQKTSEVSGVISASRVTKSEWNFTVGKGAELIERFFQMPVKLENIAKRIFQGFKTGADPVFILEERGDGVYYSNALKKEVAVEKTLLRPLFKSGEMKRYTLLDNSRYVIFPYRNGALISWGEISAETPKTAEYLLSCKGLLAKRENGRWVGNQWYCYSRNQALEIISSPKLLTADLNPFANYCYDEAGEACFPGGAAGGYGIVLEKNQYLYVLGLLNSKAVDYYHKSISTNFRGGWYGYDAKIIRNIPIRKINFSDINDVALHDKLITFVERMLALHKSLASAHNPQEADRLSREIESTDREIDSLVYELYGLTEEEIGIVEGK